MRVPNEETRMKIVYIASLARSGSSALALLLGTHPNLISLGEVYQVLGPRFDVLTSRSSKVKCTCGNLPFDCVFLGPDILRIAAAQERYDPGKV